jgi:hypothetical protein
VQDENSITSTKGKDHLIGSFNEFFIEICLSIDLLNDIFHILLLTIKDKHDLTLNYNCLKLSLFHF